MVFEAHYVTLSEIKGCIGLILVGFFTLYWELNAPFLLCFFVSLTTYFIPYSYYLVYLQ